MSSIKKKICLMLAIAMLVPNTTVFAEDDKTQQEADVIQENVLGEPSKEENQEEPMKEEIKSDEDLVTETEETKSELLEQKSEEIEIESLELKSVESEVLEEPVIREIATLTESEETEDSGYKEDDLTPEKDEYGFPIKKTLDGKCFNWREDTKTLTVKYLKNSRSTIYVSSQLPNKLRDRVENIVFKDFKISNDDGNSRVSLSSLQNLKKVEIIDFEKYYTMYLDDFESEAEVIIYGDEKLPDIRTSSSAKYQQNITFKNVKNFKSIGNYVNEQIYCNVLTLPKTLETLSKDVAFHCKKVIFENGCPNLTEIQPFSTSGSIYKNFNGCSIDEVILGKKINNIPGEIFCQTKGTWKYYKNTYASNLAKLGAFGTEIKDEEKPTLIIFNEDSLNMKIGDIFKLEATLYPKNSNCEIEWISKNRKIAEVSDGEVKALSSGQTKIIAITPDGVMAECLITVGEPTPATKPPEENPTPGGKPSDGETTLPKEEEPETQNPPKEEKLTLKVENEINTYEDDEENVVYKVSPSNASNTNVIFSDYDDSIIKVDLNGKVKALKAGETKIKVSCEGDPEVFEYVTVNVKQYEDISLNLTTDDKFSKDTVSIKVDTVGDVDFVILPNGITVESKDFNFPVSFNGRYYFTAVGKNKTKITKDKEVNTIDRIAPILIINSNVKNNSTVYSITAMDNESGIDYVLMPDGKKVNNFPAEYEYAGQGEINFIAIDKAGNISSKSAYRKAVTIVGGTVETYLAFEGIPKEWTNKDVEINIAAANKVDGVSIDLNSGTMENKVLGLSTLSLDEDLKPVFKDIVVANNKSLDITLTNRLGKSYKETIVIDKIDKYKPIVKHTYTGGTITVEASDDLSGVKSIVNPIGEMSKSFTPDYNGIYRFEVTDNAGNINNYDIAVSDKTEPVVPIKPIEASNEDNSAPVKPNEDGDKTPVKPNEDADKTTVKPNEDKVTTDTSSSSKKSSKKRRNNSKDYNVTDSNSSLGLSEKLNNSNPVIELQLKDNKQNPIAGGCYKEIAITKMIIEKVLKLI